MWEIFSIKYWKKRKERQTGLTIVSLHDTLVYVKNISRRVWSWLRMNAGGMLNTCKSYAFHFVYKMKRVADGWVTRKNLPFGEGQPLETVANTSYCWEVKRWIIAKRWACVWLASWWGKRLPRRWSVAGLRGWSATLGLRHGPDSYGRQQWGIFRNGRKPDGAMPREGWRPMGCKLLFSENKFWRYLRNKHRLTLCQQPR